MFENRRLSRICVTIIAAVALAGCGKGADTHAKAANDVVAQLQVVSDAIASATDKVSAEAAGKRITDAAAQIDRISERMRKLGRPSNQEDDAIRSQTKPQMDAIRGQMQTSMTRLRGNADALAALQGPMARLQMSLMGMSAAAAGSAVKMPAPPPPPTN